MLNTQTCLRNSSIEIFEGAASGDGMWGGKRREPQMQSGAHRTLVVATVVKGQGATPQGKPEGQRLQPGPGSEHILRLSLGSGAEKQCKGGSVGQTAILRQKEAIDFH